jgi:N-acetylglucosaminyl-diphospho-decaprenol L-rhamnosyltransferase
MAPELAVAVVNHNAGWFLGRCLGSIVGATGDVDAEVVIVDNGSTDGSVERVVEDHPDVTVIRNADNRGFARAAHQAMAATSASFVLLLNPDAEIIGGTPATLLKVARERPRAGAIGTLVRNPDGSIQPSARRDPKLGEAFGHAFLGPLWRTNPWTRSYTMAGWERSSERPVEWVSGSAMLLRRAAFEEVGGFDEGYFMFVEDVDLCTRLRRAGWEVLFSPELEVVHQIGVSTRGQRGRMAFVHSDSIYRYYCKFRATGAGGMLKPLVRVALWGRALLMAGVRGGRR